MCAWRTSPPLLADFAVSSIGTDPPMAAAFAAQSRSGGNCTTRKTLPDAGGATWIGVAQGSRCVAAVLSAGVANVFQKSVTAKLGCSMIGITCGEVSSDRMIERPSPSCPVMMRRKRLTSGLGEVFACVAVSLMTDAPLLRNDRQQQVRRIAAVVMDLVQGRLAAADVVRHVF